MSAHDHLADVGLLRCARDMAQKIEKTAAWLDRLADSAEASAKDCRFGSLVEAYKGDARNYRATAKELRSVLPKVKELVG